MTTHTVGEGGGRDYNWMIVVMYPIELITIHFDTGRSCPALKAYQFTKTQKQYIRIKMKS